MKLQLLHSKVLFFCLLYLVTCGHLNAKDAPEWVSHKPNNDSNYKYYVGRSSEQVTEAQGFSEAYEDAVKQAIRENYGISTKIDTQAYSDTSKVELTKRVSEISGNVQLTGFELVDSWVEKNKNDKNNVWIQYKYPVPEIEKEKKRLASLVGKKDTVEFQEAVGSQTGAASQPFEIVTEPAGASVYLDGQLLIAKTPLKINIENGEHSIQIDLASYKTISRKISAIESKTKRLDYKLEPSYGFINVRSVPSKAMVFVNGEPKGKTPLRNISVQDGKDAVVQIQHPETETFSQTIKLEKDEIRKINAKLSLKPAKLNISTDPVTGVAVSINGVEKGSTPLKTLILEPGTYSISFSKENYESEIQSVTLTGNEQKTLEIVKLNKKSSASIDRERNAFALYSQKWAQIESSTNEARIKKTNQAIDIDSKDAASYRLRCWIKAFSFDYEDAIKDCNKAIALKPETYVYVPSVLRSKAESEAYHNREWSKPYYIRGWSNAALGDYEGAIKDLNKTIELNPKHPEAYRTRGWTKDNLKDYAGAIKDFDKAIELNPEDELAYSNRGATKNNLGDYEGSIKDYIKAKSLGNLDAEERIKEIKETRGLVTDVAK